MKVQATPQRSLLARIDICQEWINGALMGILLSMVTMETQADCELIFKGYLKGIAFSKVELSSSVIEITSALPHSLSTIAC